MFEDRKLAFEWDGVLVVHVRCRKIDVFKNVKVALCMRDSDEVVSGSIATYLLRLVLQHEGSSDNALAVSCKGRRAVTNFGNNAWFQLDH